MKKFSDFADPEYLRLGGDKLRMSDIIGETIIITGYRISESKLKDGLYVTLQFELKGKQHVIFSGSQTLRELVQKYEHEIPFSTVIEQIGKSYRFT